jgi:hypothetical protein
VQQFLVRQFGQVDLAIAAQNVVSKVLLFRQQRINTFFDGAAGNELVDQLWFPITPIY